MVIGLILPSTPGYSETFFRIKIKFLTESGKRVIVFVNNSNGREADYEVIEGFSWRGKWSAKLIRTTNAILRLFRSPRRSHALYKLNKKSGLSTKENLKSLLSSAHILKFNLDWIHFGFATVALGKENLAKVLNAQMACSIRGYDIAIYPIKHPNCYRLLWDNIDKLHFLSDELLSLAKKHGLRNDTKSQKITPAIDSDLFQASKFHTFSKPIKILTVARLHWIKGLEYTLTALSLLQKDGIDFEFNIIGQGEDFERLVFASHQLGIKERVNFFGKKSPKEIKSVMEESNIYLQYSNHEGFCNAVLEAQAMGLLCIVSDGGALPENVLHSKTGWVVPRRNPPALAKQIIKVINLPSDEQAKISKAASKRTIEKFNLQNQAREFEAFYKN